MSDKNYEQLLYYISSSVFLFEYNYTLYVENIYKIIDFCNKNKKLISYIRITLKSFIMQIKWRKKQYTFQIVSDDNRQLLLYKYFFTLPLIKKKCKKYKYDRRYQFRENGLYMTYRTFEDNEYNLHFSSTQYNIFLTNDVNIILPFLGLQYKKFNTNDNVIRISSKEVKNIANKLCFHDFSFNQIAKYFSKQIELLHIRMICKEFYDIKKIIQYSESYLFSIEDKKLFEYFLYMYPNEKLYLFNNDFDKLLIDIYNRFNLYQSSTFEHELQYLNSVQCDPS